MNWSDIREGELKEVFDSLEEAFLARQIDFYLIGALARNVWYERGNKNFRTTRDLDFAVLISNKEDYELVRTYLIEHKGFNGTKGNAFIMRSPAGVEIDMLPFGALEIDEEGNGFLEVYHTGTEEVRLKTGHRFKIATLPAIVLLKLIAYDDRPEIRLKDAGDIINIMTHYFELEAAMIYEGHADLFAAEDGDLGVVAATVIGREIKNIAADNAVLHQRLKGIIMKQLALKEQSAFIRNMVIEIGSNVAAVTTLLESLLKGLS
ncbi:MAG: nucleotidyl transferase AbiEii/AbiGii toxin family protein [Mucilaginibacter sp.]